MSKYKVVTLGTPTSTGGKVISASSDMIVNGQKVVLIGDLATCNCGDKKCNKQGRIVKGTPRDFKINGIEPAIDGDRVLTTCGKCFLLSSGHDVELGDVMGQLVNIGGNGNGVSIGNGVSFNLVAHTPYAQAQNVSSAQQNINSKPLPEKTLTNTSSSLPSYLTGNYPQSQTEPTYPIYKNTRTFPDQRVRDLLQANNHDVMLLTLSEIFAYLQTEGWKQTKQAWVEATDTTLGQVMINYGMNGKDIVTTSMVISKLGSLGIKATVEVNHLGHEILKLSGWPNIRKILNAPRFRLDNPKVVDVGIGKYGLKNSIISGARLTFYVAAAYRTVDFILNDETSLSRYIGSLATDIAKIGIASAVSWTAGAITMALTSFAVGPLVVTVGVGLFASVGLNYFDDKYKITDRVVAHIEHAQQEAVEKAREIESGFLDLSKMFVDGLLDTGREIFVSELRLYVHKTVSEIMPRLF